VGASAAGAATFYRDVVKAGEVWTIRDAEGFPTSTNASGETTMPFWSSRSRAMAIIRGIEAYREFHPTALPLDAFLESWLPGMQEDGLFVGLNWSGKRATGYDSRPEDVAAAIMHQRGEIPRG
jgi:hypothetical protein